MEAREDEGYETAEAAARADIPERFVTVLGVRVAGDTAHVWMLTNDRPHGWGGGDARAAAAAAALLRRHFLSRTKSEDIERVPPALRAVALQITFRSCLGAR